jgi:ADP-ribosylglycohydrolase
MRSAPFGLFLRSEEALEISRESAALTHGHPTGQIAAGGLSYLIAEIIKGYELNNAVDNTIKRLKFENDSFECIDKLEDAVRLSKSNLSDIEAINELGQGWIGEEALGIAVFCALRYSDNFEKAIITSVNHDGDSDSTGSITGNILGAYLGVNEIPSKWIESIELSEKIAEIATDLLNDDDESQEWWNKYPGY